MKAIEISGFNTLRAYSAHGQRIGYALLEDRRVVFYDIDRCVHGVFNERYTDDVAECFVGIREFVMWQYDHCRYTDERTFGDAELIAIVKKARDKAERVPGLEN